jgi:hypothetical protein
MESELRDRLAASDYEIRCGLFDSDEKARNSLN